VRELVGSGQHLDEEEPMANARTRNTTLWAYRTDLGVNDVDLTGYDVAAVDGKIGKIDEASEMVGQAHVLVDTGFWIFGKKRLIPAGVVERVDHTDHTVYVDMTKEQIKSAPDFDAERRDDWDPYDTYYGGIRH